MMKTELSSIRKPGGRLFAADFLRVLAVGLVAWYHIWQQSWLDPGFSIGEIYVNLQQVVRNGYMMVDVLLVLSGFLLALPYAKAKFEGASVPRVRDFYKNRVLRIVPCYLLILTVTLCFRILPGGEYASVPAAVQDILAHLTFTQNLFMQSYYFTPLPGVLWTLGVEVQFYLIFPLLAAGYRRRPYLTSLLLCAAGWICRAWVYTHTDTTMLVNQLPVMLDMFALGMLAAALYIRVRSCSLSPALRGVLWGITVLSVCAMMQLMYMQTLGEQEVIRHSQLMLRLPMGLFAACFLLAGSMLSRGTGHFPIIVFLSSVSYNFYLWHQEIALRLKDFHIPAYVSELPNQTGEQPWMTRYTWLCFAVTLALAALITYLYEKPLTRLGHRKK